MSHASHGSPEQELSSARRGHRAGVVLSLVGALLAAIALALILVGGWRAGAGNHPSELSAWLAGFAKSSIPGVLTLFAVCCLIPGEQLRRGTAMGRSTARKTLLPAGTNVSRFDTVRFGWRFLWISVGIVVSLVLVGVPVAFWVNGGAPGSLDESHDFSGYWITYGAIAFGGTIAGVVSAARMAFYHRAIRSGLATAGQRGPGGGFWRWVDYRWRFDLWMAGIGGLSIAAAPLLIQDSIGRHASSTELAAALPGLYIATLVGAALIVLGLLASAQFWRTGEALGGGESAS